MSKIICDVCGTAYPESVSQCPICGCVRSVESRVISGKEEEAPQNASGSSYTYVRGGRFSKSNVKKRQKVRTQEQQVSDDDGDEFGHDGKKADRGLLIAFIALLIAVVAVVLYIVVKFLAPGGADTNTGKLPASGSTGSTTAMTETDSALACQGITLAQKSVSLDQMGDTYQISVVCDPVDTTDTLTFESSDTGIATVTDDGLVTAVSAGQATITIRCGNVTETFNVICGISINDPTGSTEPTVDVTVVPDDFKLNRTDFTLRASQSHYLLHKDCSIPADEITWTSSKPSVAKVVNGKVTPVSDGKAVITAEYNGVVLKCDVYVKISGE